MAACSRGWPRQMRVATLCPLLLLPGLAGSLSARVPKALRNECVAKLHPHLLSTDFLRLIYDKCTNPLDFFWAVKSSYSFWDSPRPNIPVLQNYLLRVIFPEWLPKTWRR